MLTDKYKEIIERQKEDLKRIRAIDGEIKELLTGDSVKELAKGGMDILKSAKLANILSSLKVLVEEHEKLTKRQMDEFIKSVCEDSNMIDEETGQTVALQLRHHVSRDIINNVGTASGSLLEVLFGDM